MNKNDNVSMVVIMNKSHQWLAILSKIILKGYVEIVDIKVEK
jgi:hypothetical protein